MKPASDYLDTLVDFVCETRLEDIPDAALAHLRLVFADTLAVIAAGMQSREMAALVDLHAPLAAPGRASVLGCGRKLNPMDAAALNAAAGVSLELDAGNSRSHGHPAIHCLPSALAVAQERGARGTDTLLAYAVGYEVCGRIGGAASMRIMVQPHGTYGVIGAAVTAAKLEGLPKQQMRELLNIAAAMPLGGNRKTMLDGATVRNWYAAHSHTMGQMAVRLTRAGFSGPRDAMKVSFGEVLGERFDAVAATRDLGKRWFAAEGYIKLYSGARHLHSAIDAMRDVLDQHPAERLVSENIVRIDASTHRLAAFCGEKNVTNAFGARFSVPFALATVLYQRRWDLDCFSEEAVANPALRDLMLRVDLREDPAHTAVYPQQQICELRIVLRDGGTVQGRCEVMRGECGNPHDPGEVRQKFFVLGVPVWGEALAEQIYVDALHLERIADMREIAGGASL
jgi:2-methylcitrate dehydratase PrpD